MFSFFYIFFFLYRFYHRKDAEDAIKRLDGTQIGGRALRLSTASARPGWGGMTAWDKKDEKKSRSRSRSPSRSRY